MFVQSGSLWSRENEGHQRLGAQRRPAKVPLRVRGRSAIHHPLEQRDLALREVEDRGRAQLSAVCHAHEDRNRHALAILTLRASCSTNTPISVVGISEVVGAVQPMQSGCGTRHRRPVAPNELRVRAGRLGAKHSSVFV